jgi:predicted RNase H-like HicB family nuclease
VTNYLVVIEAGDTSFGAYLPGCVAVAESRHEVTRLIREAIEHHVADLRASNRPVPRPSSVGTKIDVRP